MKKLLIIFCFFISSLAYSYPQVNIWYMENDTTTTGATFNIFIKCGYTNSADSGRIYISDLSGSVFDEVYKFKIIELLGTTPTGPSGTYVIPVTIPNYSKHCEAFGNGSNMPRLPLYVRSSTPDFDFVSFGDFSGPSGFSTFFKVDWTYEAQITDSIELSLDGILFKKIAITDIEDDSIVSFTISGSPGSHQLTSNYSIWWPYTVTSLLSLMDLQEAEKIYNITYYNIQGIEIRKPVKGFFLWKASNGLTGKEFILD